MAGQTLVQESVIGFQKVDRASIFAENAFEEHLHLALEENRLVMEIRTDGDLAGETIQLPLAPFRRTVKDYFLVCESYYEAMRHSNLTRLESIDVGRRSLHNEGATLLAERLADKIEMDHDTARGLFTLICVLHLRA